MMKSILAKLGKKKHHRDKAEEDKAKKSGLRGSLGRIIESQKFNVIVFGAIFVNALQMGVQQDWSGPAYTTFYMVLDSIFCLIFAVEMILKLAFLRCSYFKDYWNVLDFSTTWIGVIDLCILTPMYGSSGLKVLTAIRILRVFRILRIARVLRRFKELWLILHGIHQSVKTILWVSLMLGVFVYISAIVCALMIGKQKDIYPGYDEAAWPDVQDWPHVKFFNVYQRFGTMMRSMFTLFQMAILTDDWDIVTRALLEVQPAFLFGFYLFFCFCSFGLLNVIAGVVCDGVVSNSLSLQKETGIEELKKVSRALDVFQKTVFVEPGHTLGEQDICDAWGVGEFADFIKQLHLPEKCGPKEFFQLLDTDGGGHICSAEFKKGLLRLMKERQSVTELLIENKVVQTRILKQILHPNDSDPATEVGNQLQDLHMELSLLRSDLNALKPADEMPLGSPCRSSPNTVSEATNKSPVGEPEPLAEPQPEPPFAATLGLSTSPNNHFPRGLKDGPVSPQMATWIQNEVSAFLDSHLDLAVRRIAQECAIRIEASQRGNDAQFRSMSTPRFLAEIDAAKL